MGLCTMGWLCGYLDGRPITGKWPRGLFEARCAARYLQPEPTQDYHTVSCEWTATFVVSGQHRSRQTSLYMVAGGGTFGSHSHLVLPEDEVHRPMDHKLNHAPWSRSTKQLVLASPSGYTLGENNPPLPLVNAYKTLVVLPGDHWGGKV